MSLSPSAPALAVLVGTYSAAEIARRIGVSESAVRHHAKGRRTPDDAVREAYARAYDVPATGWAVGTGTEDPYTAPLSPLAVEPPPAAELPSTATALEQIRATVARIDAAIAKAEAEPRTSLGHKAQLFNAKTAALRALASLTGEGELSEGMILRSTAFGRLLAVVAEGLRAHPDALRALHEAFGRIRAEETSR